MNFSVDEWILEVTCPLDEWFKILNKTPARHGENSDLHDIFTMPWWKFRFIPCCCENSDLHIFTTPWWKFRFTPCLGENSDLHHAVVKIQIYMTFSPHVVEFSWQNLHHMWCKLIFTTKFTPHVVKIHIFTPHVVLKNIGLLPFVVMVSKN